MRIVITSGPSYEPLDKVRRLSNFSTGELGTLLAEAFAEAGHTVVCFRGVASTFPSPLWPVEVIPFTTNDDLAAGLQNLFAREETTIVFHAAALCDFRVKEITDESGEPVLGDKVPSRAGDLKVTLEPAPKLIASLHGMFPSSILVGWKYELDGALDDVRAKGRRQIEDCLTDACVLNGSAYGSGFGLISRSGEQAHLPDKVALCRFLIEWAERTPTALIAPGEPSFHALSSFNSLSPFI
ncbi:MAG: phosphopantothenoylcysteine synthase [Methylacidiphilales bacterium]|nr:phosphopantothenoylcysteine synthase [Candidatus Methylacidiphilales bacterium]